MYTTLTPAAVRIARQEIAAADAVMAALIARLPPLKPRRTEPPFHTIATSIINHQLSQKAAAAIEKRLALLTPPPFSPALTRQPRPALRQAGLSGNKIDYLHGLAAAEADGLLDIKSLRKLSDDDLIQTLVSIRGVGRWTAEMFLIFGLRRTDVLSLGDAGLRRAARKLYGKRFRGDDAAVLEKAAARWRPWRTVGCYYLWRSLDS